MGLGQLFLSLLDLVLRLAHLRLDLADGVLRLLNEAVGSGRLHLEALKIGAGVFDVLAQIGAGGPDAHESGGG